MPQAEDNRDAMAKAVYGRLFTWIVSRANELLAPRSQLPTEAQLRGSVEIGILDIFGFENFQNNSFEQVGTCLIARCDPYSSSTAVLHQRSQ